MTDATGQAEHRPAPLGEAAARLGLSTDALRKRCERGRVPGAYKLDGRWWVPVADVTGPTGQPSDRTSALDDRPGLSGQADPALLAALAEMTAELRAVRRLLEAQARPAELTGPISQSAEAAPPGVAGVPAVPAPPRRPWWRWWGGQDR